MVMIMDMIMVTIMVIIMVTIEKQKNIALLCNNFLNESHADD